MVVRSLPSPVEAQKTRATTIIHGSAAEAVARRADQSEETKAIETAVSECRDAADTPTVVFIAKMTAVPRDALPDNRRVQLSAEELRERRRKQLQEQAERQQAGEQVALDAPPPTDAPAADVAAEVTTDAVSAGKAAANGDIFVGFGRVFSGTVRAGQTIYVLGPKYDPRDPTAHATPVTIERVFLIMGRDLTDLEEAHAGSIVAISGISDHVLKSGTLSSSLACPSFCKLHLNVAPIVRVAVEPAVPSQMSRLVDGLRLLSQADPSVEVYVQDSGEHILATTGELHLERCMTDLRERFAQIEIEHSEPIVPFREAIAGKSHNNDYYGLGESGAPVDERPCNVVIVTPRGANVTITLKVVPLPEPITTFLLSHAQAIKAVTDGVAGARGDKGKSGQSGVNDRIVIFILCIVIFFYACCTACIFS